MIAKQLFTSSKKDWTTPELILERVRKVHPIGLDPCTGPGSIVKARLNITEKQDGLANPWPKIRANEQAFVNWPYGNKENKAWARKCVSQLKTHPQQTHLVAARTSETWLQDHILAAKPTAIAFCHKRLRFSNAKHVATFPSMVVYFGKRLAEFTKAFEDLCWVVPRPKRGTYPIGIRRTTKKTTVVAKKKDEKPTKVKLSKRAPRKAVSLPAPKQQKIVKAMTNGPVPVKAVQKVAIRLPAPAPAPLVPRFGKTRLPAVGQ